MPVGSVHCIASTGYAGHRRQRWASSRLFYSREPAFGYASTTVHGTALAERSTNLLRYVHVVLDVEPLGPTAVPLAASQQQERADNAYLWIRSMEMQIGER